MRFILLIFFLLPLALSASGIRYSVEFEGLDDGKALQAMKKVSQLTSLKKRPPASINALRYRAESDIPELIKVLHAYGYYEGRVNVYIPSTGAEDSPIRAFSYRTFEEGFSSSQPVRVVVFVDPGPLYHIENYHIRLLPVELKEIPQALNGSLEHLLQRKTPALTQTLLETEMRALQELSEYGFPLADIQERQIVVDGLSKGVSVTLSINARSFASFGPVTLSGLQKVKPLFVEQNIDWSEGAPYSSELVEKTQSALLDSGLFNSVLITHDPQLNAHDQLPMRIEVSETSHKSVNIGVSYQTVFGPGLTFGWENKNVGGMGRLLSLQGDVTRISHTGVGLYVHPNFIKMGQDYIWQAQAMHEALFAYSMRSYNVINRLDRRIKERVRISMGILGERLYVTASKQNGNYWLVELPFYIRYSTANDLLNPTQGITLEWTTTPSFDLSYPKNPFLINQISESAYYALDTRQAIVLAEQLTIGSILSPTFSSIPLSKRYFGGSEQELRGYRYRTVSPLDDEKPIGGRSAVYLTLETRLRLTKTLGLVPFFDLGWVQKSILPSPHGKWFKSTGLGFRYFSFMGPFRIDIAFPLNRRKGIDPVYKILASIGQTF